MGASSKRKGGVYERELVDLLQAQGLQARRVYASGAVGTILRQSTGQDHQDLRGDVQVQLGETTLCVEVKFRKAGFPRWLTHLEEPTQMDGWVLYPGVNLEAVLRSKSWKKTAKPMPSTLKSLLGNSDLLALRFPKNPKNPSGWILARPI